MDEKKKKSGKLKKIVKVVVVIFAILFIRGMFIGGDDKADSPDKKETVKADKESDSSSEADKTEPETEVAPDEKEVSAPAPEPPKDTRHQIGETVAFQSKNGGELNVTLTNWGSTFDGIDQTVLYVSYAIENVGKESIWVGSSLFNVYADDYLINQTNIINGADSHYGDLSAGRKTDGTFYAEINPDNATVIEVECGGSVFVLKDDSPEGNSASDAAASNGKINPSEISGRYGALSGGQTVLDISIYSSPENEMIGKADAGSWSGEIAEIETNTYQIYAKTEQQVVLKVSKADDGTITAALYVDGKLKEEYAMTEHYES